MAVNTSTETTTRTSEQAAVQLWPIASWLITNWPSILAVVGTIIGGILFAGELLGGNKPKSEAYKNMSPEEQKKVDSIRQDLEKAITREEPAGVAKALRDLSKAYGEAAETISARNPTVGREAKELSKALSDLSSAVAKGKIQVRQRLLNVGQNDSGVEGNNLTVGDSLSTRLASENTENGLKNAHSKESNKNSDIALSPVGTVLPTTVAINLIKEAIQSLGDSTLNEKNATQIAKMILDLKLLPPEQVQSAFEQYYHHVQGLSTYESTRRAEQIVENALKSPAKENNIVSRGYAPGE